MRKTFAMTALALSLGLPLSAQAADFTLESTTFKNGMVAPEQVFNGFGCTGKNISPALSWKNAPQGTKSFALMVHDPDAPTGGAGWWHWAVVNIPAATNMLPEGAGDKSGSKLPAGTMHVRTDFGFAGYGGACPPKGDKPHRYIFTLYALKTDKLDLPADASASLAGFMINANSLGSANFTVTYQH